VMSGGGRRAIAERKITGGTAEAPSADMVDAAFATSLGIMGEGEDALAALRALPAEALLGDLTFPVMTEALLTQGNTEFPGTPMIDGVIVTGRLESMFLGGEATAAPLIVGTTALDAPGFFPPRADPFSYFGPDAEAAAAVFNPGGMLPPELVLLGIAADMTMHEPARFVARSMTGAGNPAWLYRFTYVAEARENRTKGAAHAYEVPYLFQTVEMVEGEATTENDRQMAQWISGYIANFVKTGEPNGGDLPAWPIFNPSGFELMHFTLADGLVFEPDPRAARVELVERAADARAAEP
jgi:para-nitrobenzyl esterase